MLDQGLALLVNDLDSLEFSLKNGKRISLWIIECRLEKPTIPPNTLGARDTRIWPTEARQRGTSYKGRFWIKCGYAIDKKVAQNPLERMIGSIPVMLKSKVCNLQGLRPCELIDHGEQESEWGGYFIIGGHERLIRMLQTTRRNYPIAMQRPSWKNRGKNFSDLGVQIDCGCR